MLCSQSEARSASWLRCLRGRGTFAALFAASSGDAVSRLPRRPRPFCVRQAGSWNAACRGRLDRCVRSGPPRSPRSALRVARDRPFRACGRSPHHPRPFRAKVHVPPTPAGKRGGCAAWLLTLTLSPLVARSGRVAGRLTPFVFQALPRCSRVALLTAPGGRRSPFRALPLVEHALPAR